MIEPTQNDIGRKVVYTGNRFPGGQREEGVIKSFNARAVFVRYGADEDAKATARREASVMFSAVAEQSDVSYRLTQASYPS